MMTGCAFPGDDDRLLMEVQHELYGELVGWLFAAGRDRYLTAIRLVGTETELGQRVKDRRFFDHRVLQRHHDLLAAHFRYRHPETIQLCLSETPLEHRQHLEDLWRRWLGSEVKILVERDHVTRAITTAVGYENEEIGLAAERHLARLLWTHYGPIPGCTGWFMPHERAAAPWCPHWAPEAGMAAREAEGGGGLAKGLERLCGLFLRAEDEMYQADVHKFDLWECARCGVEAFAIEIRHGTASSEDDFRGVITSCCSRCGTYEVKLSRTGLRRLNPEMGAVEPAAATACFVAACGCGGSQFRAGTMARFEGAKGLVGFFDELVVAARCESCGRYGVIVGMD